MPRVLDIAGTRTPLSLNRGSEDLTVYRQVVISYCWPVGLQVGIYQAWEFLLSDHIT